MVELIFRHQSPNFYKELKSVSYNQIDINRENPEYLEDRIENEAMYHALLNHKNEQLDTSFIYATIVGFHKMQSAKTYLGYTYYFKLTPEQINDTIFQVVGQGPHTTNPIPGRKGLLAAIDYWLKHKNQLKPYYDAVVGGNIDPRIEVIIGYPVQYLDYVPQIEDRRQ